MALTSVGVHGATADDFACEQLIRDAAGEPLVTVRIGTVAVYGRDPDALRAAARAFTTAAVELGAALASQPAAVTP